MRGLAVAAALLSFISTAAPTGYLVFDRLWCAAAAVGLTFISSRATRATWLWMTAVAAAASIGSWTALLAVAALAIAAASTFSKHRPRIAGAAIGALASGALLSLPDLGPHGLCSVVVVLAATPVVVASYRRSPRRVRKILRRTVGWGLVAVVAAGLVLGVAAGLSARSMVGAVDDATTGLDSVRDGNQIEGAASFAEAAEGFGRAERLLGGLWTWPARAVPVMSQHAQAMSAAASSGYDLSTSAEVAASVAPYRDLKARDGKVDIPTVVAMQEPVAQAADSLQGARDQIAEVRSPWLLQPATSALDQLDEEIAGALPEARLAEQALAVAPDMLGAGDDRRYLVLFTSPAETRNLGGFAGSYGVLEASDGEVDITVSGGISELARASDYRDRGFLGLDEFLTRYDRYQPARYFQNLTASPDMETTANVAAQMYLQTTGEPLDGVIVADPFALQGLLALTGPVEVPSIDRPLTKDNAAEFLLLDQYVLYEGERDARKDRLEDAGRATFDALTSRSLPNPRAVGRVLGPLVDEKHLMFFPFEADEQALMEEVDALGRFAVPEESDFLSVRSANLRPNKIDTFVQRSTRYDATYDPETGTVEATVTVRFRNDAPPGGLPDYVIGPQSDRYPLGTARIFAGVYSPLSAVDATLDGLPVGIEPQVELGANVYSATVVVPPGGEATLQIRLIGTIAGMGDVYHLLASSQPLATDDTLVVTLNGREVAPESGGGRSALSSEGTPRDDTDWSTDLRYVVDVAG